MSRTPHYLLACAKPSRIIQSTFVVDRAAPSVKIANTILNIAFAICIIANTMFNIAFAIYIIANTD